VELEIKNGFAKLSRKLILFTPSVVIK